MKQIPILSGKAMIVELPEGAKFPRIETDQSVIPYGQDLTWYINGGEKSYGMDETEWVSLPPGNWRIIGMLSEVTEEDAEGLVESDNEYGVVMYRNYKTTAMPYYDEQITALESLESAIEAEGYYLDENPIAVPDFSGGNIRFSETVEYAKAQSRVLCRERCLLLGREG